MELPSVILFSCYLPFRMQCWPTTAVYQTRDKHKRSFPGKTTAAPAIVRKPRIKLVETRSVRLRRRSIICWPMVAEGVEVVLQNFVQANTQKPAAKLAQQLSMNNCSTKSIYCILPMISSFQISWQIFGLLQLQNVSFRLLHSVLCQDACRTRMVSDLQVPRMYRPRIWWREEVAILWLF